MNKLIAGILIVVVAVAGIYIYHKYRVAPNIKFQTLELTDLNGKPVKLEDYKDKKLFLNFYATWCGPCVGEFPALDEASHKLAGDNFLFISISDEPLPLLNRFSAHLNSTSIILLHSEKKLHELGVYTVPTNYLLNSKGAVVFEKIGEQNWAEAGVLDELRKKGN